MVSKPSLFRRQQPVTRKTNRGRPLLLEPLEDRVVPTALQLSVSPHDIVEPTGPNSTAVGTLTRVNDNLSQPLTVNLVSSDTTEATVPPSVVIPAGQSSATFSITAVNDFIPDGSQNVTITATAQLPTHVQADTTFGGTGSVPQGTIPQDVALQPDGKIVTAGLRYNGGSSNYYDFAVSRFNPNGSPDTTFGTNGTVFTDVSGQSDRAHAVVIQPNGEILVGGTGGDGPHFFWVLARYNPDGTLDTTFGNGGKLVTNPSPSGYYNELWDLALQPDGKILAAGNIDTGSDTEFAVARYNPNGSLDTYFGASGIATSHPTPGGGDRAYSVLVQPDGGIVLVGGTNGGNSVSHFALSRFMPWGYLDYTFGSGGTVITDIPGNYEEAFDAALQPDGKIVAVGQTDLSGSFPSVYDFALARYNANGSLDTSFGSGGIVTTNFGGNDQAEGVALAGDGRIVVTGGGVTKSNSTMYTVIADYNADGSLGNSYLGRNTGVQGQALAIQPDGRVVAVSSQNTAFGGFVERFNPVMLISASDSLTVEDNPNPSVQPDSYDLSEDQTFYSNYNYPNYSVLSNDYSPNGGLTASLVSGPSHGTLTFNADGTFVYTPAPNYNGTDGFVYRATDPIGLSGQAPVTLTVWPVDDPIAISVPGSQTIDEDTSLTFSAANGKAITVSDADQPRVLVSLLIQDGILTLPSTDGLEFPYSDSVNNSPHITFYAASPAVANAALDGLVLTPNPNYHGAINLNVYAQDTTAGNSYYGSTSANVSITVNSVNDAPVAVADSYQAYEDQTFNTYGASVLNNDSDVDGDPLTAVLVSGPAHGTLNLSSNGTFTYTPAPNYNGPDSFTYQARDPGGLLSAPATVSLDVAPVDDPIQISGPGPQTIAEDTTFTFSLASGTAITITDPESPRVLVVLLVQDGILSLGSTAGLTFPDPSCLNNTAHVTFTADNPDVANAAMDGLVFTPDPNYNGTVYFNAWVQDLSVVSSYPVTASVTVPITVTPVDDAPVAVDDVYTVQAGVPLVTAPYSYGGNIPGVLWNDQDVEFDRLTAVLVSGPAHGTLSLNSDGSFTYTADATYAGTDTFTYYAFDGQLPSNVATVTFTVTPNLPPVTAGDSYSVNEDDSLSVAAPGVLGNDSDPEGQPLTAQLASGPAHGTLTFNVDGSFTYTPAANYNGADQFTYRASDGTFLSDPVVVALTVNPVNDPPVASNDSYSVDEDVVLTASAPGVLGNDTDVDGDTLSASVVSGPSHGTLNMNADGSFSYTPNANYNGSDSFTYKANDGQADSNVATVSITVNAVNDAPVAVDDAYSLDEDQTLIVAPTPGVTSLSMVSQPGDYIGQGQSYSYTPQTGTFTISRNFDNGVSIAYSGGSHWWHLDFAAPFDATLTPGTYANATRWPFQATNVPGLSVYGDGRGSNTLTGSFTVTQALYAADGTVLRFAASFVQHSEGMAPALTGTIDYNAGDLTSGILLNDYDVEGSPLSITVVSNPAHGTLSMNVDGSFKYTPAANYNGTDSFTYKVSDGQADSNLATVSLTVRPVNDPPVANNNAYTLAEDNVLTVTAPGVLANDSDVDGDTLTASLVTSPAHGSLTFNADGSFSYTPNANYNGSDSFTYKANDGQANSNVATVTLTVTPVNDPPVVDAGPDQTVNEGSTVSFSGSASDVDGDPLSYLWDFGDGGTATGATPTHVYADNGVYTATLTVSDGQGGSTSDSLVVTVNNVAPTLTLSGASAVNEGSTYTLSLAASDPGQDTIAKWTITWGDGNVQTVSGNPGSVSHTYADGPLTVTISATATDEDGTYNAGNSVNVTVNNVAPTASLSGPATGARGQLRTFTLGAADPSAVDQAGSFTFNINWGDGNSQPSTGPASQQLGHVYTTAGTYTVQITATDKDGGVSTTVQQTITINAVDLQGGNLAIGGTTADDNITVAPADASGNLAVTINGVAQGTFAPPAQIVVYDQAGNDQIKLNTKKIGPTTYYVTVPAALFGDAGNDTLDARGSTANNILIGGAGTDQLQGGSGRDLLIGGAGADTLHGNGGDDLVIGNSTDFDANLSALNAIMAEWGRTDADYATRISHLNGSVSGGLNGGTFLNGATVYDDAALDQLYGESGSDWFFYTASGNNKDKLNDLASGEVATGQ
jgi:uncharacterized delta-60 repeat protein